MDGTIGSCNVPTVGWNPFELSLFYGTDTGFFSRMKFKRIHRHSLILPSRLTWNSQEPKTKHFFKCVGSFRRYINSLCAILLEVCWQLMQTSYVVNLGYLDRCRLNDLTKYGLSYSFKGDMRPFSEFTQVWTILSLIASKNGFWRLPLIDWKSKVDWKVKLFPIEFPVYQAASKIHFGGWLW